MPAELEILLVRHTESVVPTAGGPSELARPLTGREWRQAEELADVLVAVLSGEWRSLRGPGLSVRPGDRAGG